MTESAEFDALMDEAMEAAIEDEMALAMDYFTKVGQL
jgi:hypothetical protein